MVRTKKQILSRIGKHPNDPAGRLLYADWLKDHGHIHEAKKQLAEAKRLTERRDKLVMENQGLVGMMLARLLQLPAVQARPQGAPASDAQLGLLYAANLWREDFGVKFSTYACRGIAREVFRHINDDWLIRVPETSSRRKPSPKWESNRQECRAPIERGASTLSIRDPRSAEEADEKEVERSNVDEAVASLPLAQAAVVDALWYRGLSPAEAAEELAISPELLKAWKEKALTALRKKLAA
jgi:RNA polymerase sigma factor (sigma-70 family)